MPRWQLNEHTARIDSSGRLVVPAALRKELGLNPGAAVTLRVTGGELRVAAETLEDAVVSAVNLSEVVGKLLETGMPRQEAEDTLGGLGLEVRPFDEAAAWNAGALRTGTKKAGLSLGNRTCLALAKELGLPAVTADSARARTSAGVEVRLVR